MFLLHRASNNIFMMDLKAQAAANGAEVDWDDDWYDPKPPEKPQVIHGDDVRFLPIGLGYQME